jgi:hypothetical protein
MPSEKVTVTAEPLSRFREATDALTVCDPQGRTLGYFLPPDLYHDCLYAWAKAQFADETGLEAVRNEPGGYTTPEAIARLAEVAKSGRKAS